MPITDADKTDIRRHCGYPVFGDTASPAFGYRFFTQYGTLEYRINHLSASEESVVVQMLLDCATLEKAVIDSGENLDTNRAAVWERNPKEVADRRRLYNYSRRKLCGFLGVPPGPALASGSEIVV